MKYSVETSALAIGYGKTALARALGSTLPQRTGEVPVGQG